MCEATRLRILDFCLRTLVLVISLLLCFTLAVRYPGFMLGFYDVLLR